MERLSNSISSLTTNADSNIQGLTTLSQIMKNRPRVMIILRGLPGSGKVSNSKERDEFWLFFIMTFYEYLEI